MGTTRTAALADSPAKKGMGGVQTVAMLLDCSTRHVYRLSDAGRMPRPVKLGSLVRWNLAEIDAWISAGCPAVRKVIGKRVRA